MFQVSCCSLFLFCQPPWAGAFSGNLTTNLDRQCRAFSRALKIEKLKAPLFRGPKGAGATNDWCIRLGGCNGCCHMLADNATLHHANMFMKCKPHHTPLLYSKTGVYRCIHFFLIFAPKHRL